MRMQFSLRTLFITSFIGSAILLALLPKLRQYHLAVVTTERVKNIPLRVVMGGFMVRMNARIMAFHGNASSVTKDFSVQVDGGNRTLCMLLDPPSPDDRMKGVYVASILENIDDATLKKIIKAFRDDRNVNVRAFAAYCLGERGSLNVKSRLCYDKKRKMWNSKEILAACDSERLTAE